MRLFLIAAALLLTACYPPDRYIISALVKAQDSYALRIQSLETGKFRDFTGIVSGQHDWPEELAGRNCMGFAVASRAPTTIIVLRDGEEVTRTTGTYTWTCFNYLARRQE